MDGAGRFLRSLTGFPAPAYAGAAPGYVTSGALRKNFPRARQRQHQDRRAALLRIAALPGFGLALTLCLFAGVGLYGAQRSGAYDIFVRDNGSPSDIFARALGFGVDSVAISGQIELNEAQILKAAGIDGRASLPFLDAAKVRAQLMTVPLIKNANVRKLLPNRLAIEITERTPYAVWQRDGVVSIVAADGAPIDEFRDISYTRLPFVVGDNANLRIADYQALLDAAGDLRPRVRAGALVSNRRWTLTMTNGVEVMLPEQDAARGALTQLARLEAESHILEKDIVSLDFRTPGRLFVRLTEEAGAAREAAHSHKGARK